jgi:hypothetical protein
MISMDINMKYSVTDVSAQPIGLIFMIQAWSLKMGPMASPETSLITNTRCVTTKKNEYI